ncbi:hypothetical protein CH373_12635 [Leptospira perolatii]|uniref:Lipoprotein n=1 Tax=Leptospira perolatii TaxID=2023191 RepID=A0A2M9ZLE7_9LEPT|nr:hypothetical protein [Leptospira perolatii]PJZ70219.1 hypothetical protein CH360_06335 [Leptospira perolatii]PJZ72896.1 hypothetical protein CH373_12635 [Leptospira perolatii]
MVSTFQKGVSIVTALGFAVFIGCTTFGGKIETCPIGVSIGISENTASSAENLPPCHKSNPEESSQKTPEKSDSCCTKTADSILSTEISKVSHQIDSVTLENLSVFEATANRDLVVNQRNLIFQSEIQFSRSKNLPTNILLQVFLI